jgi:hypothetical protein
MRTKSFPKHTDFRARHPHLLNVEGWFESQANIPDWAITYFQAWEQTDRRLKFTRYLTRNGVDAGKISTLGQALVPVTVKLSCRHRDLLRLAETPHYKSCFSETNRGQLTHFLADPDVAVVYSPDAAGKFVWRALVRLVHDNQHWALVLYKPYGNGPTDGILSALANKTGLSIYRGQPRAETSGRWLMSPTRHNNRLIISPVWSDHPQQFREGRIHVLCADTPQYRPGIG